MPPRQSATPPGAPRRRQKTPYPGGWIWLLLLAAVIAAILWFPLNSGTPVNYSDFRKLLQEKKLSKVTFVGADGIVAEVKEDFQKEAQEKYKIRSGRFTTRIPGGNEQAGKLSDEIAKDYPDVEMPPKQDEPSAWFGVLLLILVPTALILGLIFLFILPRLRDPLGGGFLSSYIRSPARRYEKNKTRVTFDDVADMENAKSELREVVEFLRSPEKFQRLGEIGRASC